MTKIIPTQLVILSAGLLALLAHPVLADGVNVRVTTGSVTNAGWERNLVKGNPNLGHFGWFPVASNVQGIQRIYPPKGPNFEGMRPAQAPRNQQLIRDVRLFHKPNNVLAIHVPTIVHRQSQESNNQVGGQLRSQNISAKLSQPDDSSAVNARLNKSNDIAAYPDAYGSLSSAGSSNSLIGSLRHNEVHAQITHLGQVQNRSNR